MVMVYCRLPSVRATAVISCPRVRHQASERVHGLPPAMEAGVLTPPLAEYREGAECQVERPGPVSGRV